MNIFNLTQQPVDVCRFNQPAGCRHKPGRRSPLVIPRYFRPGGDGGILSPPGATSCFKLKALKFEPPAVSVASVAPITSVPHRRRVEPNRAATANSARTPAPRPAPSRRHPKANRPAPSNQPAAMTVPPAMTAPNPAASNLQRCGKSVLNQSVGKLLHRILIGSRYYPGRVQFSRRASGLSLFRELQAVSVDAPLHGRSFPRPLPLTRMKKTRQDLCVTACLLRRRGGHSGRCSHHPPRRATR